jgi:hypothetical protein
MSAFPIKDPSTDQHDVFIYLQIVNLNQIDKEKQTFNAKFYIRASWVQEQEYQDQPNTMQELITDDSEWPKNVYKPNLSFDNSTNHIQLFNQSVGISQWREATLTRNDDDASYAVFEWKASGIGTFAFQDVDMNGLILKIDIGCLDGRIHLHDDHRDMVQSMIRVDHIYDSTYKLVKIDDALQGETWCNSGSSMCDDDTKNGCGNRIVSQEKRIVINARNERSFSTLTYIVPMSLGGQVLNFQREALSKAKVGYDATNPLYKSKWIFVN